MSLKEEVSKIKQKYQEEQKKHEEFINNVVELFPEKCNQFIQMVEDICKDSDLDYEPEEIEGELFLNYNGQLLGKVKMKQIKIKLFNNYIKFIPDFGIGYIGATGKIIIESNINDWQRKFNMKIDGILIVFKDDFSKSSYHIIDLDNKTHEVNKKTLEDIIRKIFFGEY
jgi:hypothetical protein